MINGILARFRAVFVTDQVSRPVFTSYNWLSIILLTSVGVTVSVWGMRGLKWLQAGELSIYDQMLRDTSQSQKSPLPEPLERRILLVTITQEDLTREKWPLSDQTINKLLEKLESYQPRVIGLNIYRNEQTNLGTDLQKQDNIIGTCLLSNLGRSEIPPPPHFPIENIGFDDVVTDNFNDQVIRRSLLFTESTNTDYKCQTQFSFPALLAIKYLEKEGITYNFNKNKELQIGKTLFPRLDQNAGSYQHTDADGYQILLNYRHPNNLVQQVTLTQVLANQINPNWVKDRLVIIGTTAASVHPGYYTPYSGLPDQPARMPRVFIHAQVASQILSTVLDGRPLIYYWTDWAEFLWIWVCALVGAVLAWQWRHPLLLLLVASFILFSLLGIAAGLYLQGIWIPLFAPSLAVVISSITMMLYTSYRTQQENQAILLQVEKQQEAIAQLSLLFDQDTAFPSQFNYLTISDISIPRNEAALLAGRYKISRSLGSGGFGRTYLAADTQRQGNPICVVKQLMPARQDTRFLQVARRLFNTEAEILAVLGKHPQIPELFAYFEDNQEFYLVQEYISGQTLSEELIPEKGVKSEVFVVDMLKEILEILVFIHQYHVIHRDIKPTNIMRCAENNKLVLIDFGAVKLIQPRISGETELATIAIGTRGYSPPEQFAGHPRLSSDIYALGMIAIQAITGISPQELQPNPETGNIMWQHTTTVSTELAAILEKMVCYHFSDRYQSASAVLQDLKSFVIRNS
ncbi:CHASE2 domain-containing protein [Anabaena cylindrica FACHB-243]|uniref:CHASE2 domain-containing serine/threonine-protein kinase n=1 Tax=Anabaena TaxID=1163 RepID=UPI0005A5FE0A|nr:MULTISPECIES: CHASE2 domain-containing serine/threonine-protein kinase [Anabaena]MBD2419368.1 CHASE2 domain-containing protein [Anabaena cylindrica FACHB-243]MBY5280628.1 CHASE2 domain-containing protein [Anabaena sp. CCAP 1446/1C]MBY5307832.1 CHASE2 domain-containing protein [Anabaena sp. CCAP 1446/1C]MCM2409187.1 CHASE2 domain-containing serine/threonine-protein kinase [Anabaena sp. CCAP 1446/1C]